MNRCNTCIKQGRGCPLEAHVDRAHCRAWEGIPAEPACGASLATAGLKMAEESAKKAEQERDLAIWWEAYLQLLTSVARNGEKLNVIADYALADYRAKREELSKDNRGER